MMERFWPARRPLHWAPVVAASLVMLAGCQPMALTIKPTAEQAATADAVEPVMPPSAAKASMIAPIVEKRETISATGYAVISVQSHKLPAQQRLMAIRASKLDAYRSLTEQVYGQHLDASTTVADMMVTSDTFRTRVEGVIYGARLVSITPIGEDTYETTLSLDAQVVDDLRALYLGSLASHAKR
jgi:hypothetical protein